MPVPLSESIEKIGPRACAAVFYRAPEDWLEPASVWLRVWLARGEKCVAFGSAAFGAEILAFLQKAMLTLMEAPMTTE